MDAQITASKEEGKTPDNIQKGNFEFTKTNSKDLSKSSNLMKQNINNNSSTMSPIGKAPQSKHFGAKE